MNANVHDLSRFCEAQKLSYPRALQEIKNGKKITHWMWYIFPQITGLGMSSMSHLYAIKNISEARAYLHDVTLGKNLREITSVLLELNQSDPVAIFGNIDAVKLRSCMTLFAVAADDPTPFLSVLDKYFHGKKDGRTLSILYDQSKQ